MEVTLTFYKKTIQRITIEVFSATLGGDHLVSTSMYHNTIFLGAGASIDFGDVIKHTNTSIDESRKRDVYVQISSTITTIVWTSVSGNHGCLEWDCE